MAAITPQPDPQQTEEAARLEAAKELAQQIAQAWHYANGLAKSIMEIEDGAMQIHDRRRWQVACKLLAAADHEFGKAVR